MVRSEIWFEVETRIVCVDHRRLLMYLARSIRWGTDEKKKKRKRWKSVELLLYGRVHATKSDRALYRYETDLNDLTQPDYCGHISHACIRDSRIDCDSVLLALNTQSVSIRNAQLARIRCVPPSRSVCPSTRRIFDSTRPANHPEDSTSIKLVEESSPKWIQFVPKFCELYVLILCWN